MNKTQLSLDPSTMRLIEEKFAHKRQIALEKENELFGIFNESLTADEELALKYLYAYMPLNDMADYDGSLFLEHVRQVLQIRKAVPWGEKIPDTAFFHFVLPYRVNNENIEVVRQQLFEELYPRVQGLSMYDAILETNHWCHEKANYIGNDRRTVSPLTLIRTALGRCGEQSTLGVTALRSIGIPARQCYTPRWAHCDSNHAWVEAWADGTWHFLGACEPEPRLNQGWFRRPARRAMLVHTRLASNYPGPEEVTLARPWYSELNLLHLYADTKNLLIRIVDAEGNPAQAKADIQLYNYAELSTIVPLRTDAAGTIAVTLGLGDVYINAYGSAGWAFAKCSAEQQEITIVLSNDIARNETTLLEMAPPPDLPDLESERVTEEEKNENNRRIKEGAQIRADYEATFLREEDAKALAAECSLNAEQVWNVLRKARGNSHEIAAFIRKQSPVYGEWCLRLLEVMNEKDLTDTFMETLDEHLTFAMKVRGAADDDTFASYILNPRVHFEMITPYRAFFQEQFGESDRQTFVADPYLLAGAIDQQFIIMDDMTYYQGSATPAGSYRLMRGDRPSLDILFVAVARSIGIPARLEPSDKRPQFLAGGEWRDVRFSGAGAEPGGRAAVETGSVIWLKDDSSDEEAKYSLNFTVAYFEDGKYETLQFGFGKSDVYDAPFEMKAGHHRLTTGTRLEDGTALVRLHYFEIKPGQQATIPLIFRKQQIEIPVVGVANLSCEAESHTGQKQTLSDLTGANGAFFVWLEPDREPSKHLLRELREMKSEWDSLGVSIVCFIGEEKWSVSAGLLEDKELPANIWFGKETNGLDTLALFDPNRSDDQAAAFPIVYAVDKENRIRYHGTGYKLGISKDAINLFKELNR
ncbi:transglutaminase-like domain-containing protein [Paenibacillus sp. LHD-117]|uniref:transglutaminase-like domain-containing protein n=1 Tax=Paenibacillus sp. LHD-117 TaxID=3071412 RepID=UPI0027E1E304|nr:transglutaminase-like domain-containing protein [Paenibacillus sp. LHD-117]MDQ6420017.1 transglutaminase-like domain-containing protein [Paenibacillus sp. LHD-117]